MSTMSWALCTVTVPVLWSGIFLLYKQFTQKWARVNWLELLWVPCPICVSGANQITVSTSAPVSNCIAVLCSCPPPMNEDYRGWYLGGHLAYSIFLKPLLGCQSLNRVSDHDQPCC